MFFATAAELPVGRAVLEAARPALAMGLPQSPAVAVALLLVVLAITYALLTVFIRVSVPSPSRTGEDVEDDGPPDPDWPSETVPDYPEPYGQDRASEESPAVTEYIREPLTIESVRVRDVLLTLGDPASRVMAAFRPGEGETVPMVQRDTSGRASYVSRTYRVGRRVLTLVLERDSPTAPLTLVRIDTTT